jgi:hypothetical protein
VALLALAPGCLVVNDVEVSDLVGDWIATQARLANPDDLNETVDITELGWEVTIQIESDGAYTTVLQEPGAAPITNTGTLTVENGKDLILARSDGFVGTGEVFLEDDQVAFRFDEISDPIQEGNIVSLLVVMVRP